MIRDRSLRDGDLVPDAAGNFELQDELLSQLEYSLGLPKGSWEGDPDLGHEFDQVRRVPALDGIERRVADLARNAVAWLVTEGSLARVEVDAWRESATMVGFEMRAYRPSAQQPLVLLPRFVAVGVE